MYESWLVRNWLPEINKIIDGRYIWRQLQKVLADKILEKSWVIVAEVERP